MHRVPDHIPPAEAALFLPMANGVEWMYRYGDLRLGDTVLVQGPGQQGLAAVLTAKEAGAECIIVTGLSHDAHRLALAKKLGADHTIDEAQGLGGLEVDAQLQTSSLPNPGIGCQLPSRFSICQTVAT